MKGARRLVRDPRFAAGVVVVAVLLVGHRVLQLSGAASASTLAAGAAAAPGEGRDAGAEAAANAALPAGALSSLSRGAARNPPSPLRGEGRGGGRDIGWSWDRNPFLPAWRDASARPDTSVPRAAVTGGAVDPFSSLRGTVVSGGERYAIVGDRVIPLGETVGGWTVEGIEPYQVVLRRGAEKRTLELVKPVPGGTRGGGER